MSVAMLMNITDSLLQAEGNEILQITLWNIMWKIQISLMGKFANLML